MMLEQEIAKAQRTVRTDAYQMSVGEVVSLYEDGDLVIDPEFQRLFRWEIGQKSKLIESLLLGIPLPPLFVFENDDGKWELVDGLQRISTILEFMGKLREPDKTIRRPSILEATRYLPSLHNVVWTRSHDINNVLPEEQNPLEKPRQLAIRRARIGVEILKRPSDNKTKFDLFQRLNAGGTQANAQELRNSIVLMINSDYFREIKEAAETDIFKKIAGVTEDQEQKQRHIEFAMRFLVHSFIPYDGKLDVEEYVDEGVIQLANENNIDRDLFAFKTTFGLLYETFGEDALRRIDGNKAIGRVGLVALEVIAVGVCQNLKSILALHDSHAFIAERTRQFWSERNSFDFTQQGIRGTTRIQKTVPYGVGLFRP